MNELELFEGVTFTNPSSVTVDEGVSIEAGCTIAANVNLVGSTTIGKNTTISSGCVISNTRIGESTEIGLGCKISDSDISGSTHLDGYLTISRSTIGENSKLYSFSSLLNCVLGANTSVYPHCDLRDITAGNKVHFSSNVSCSNFDGANYFTTEIEDDVILGTGTILVAPITIEKGAFVAAGSTLTSKVKAGDLAVGRARQRNIEGWKRPDKREQPNPEPESTDKDEANDSSTTENGPSNWRSKSSLQNSHLIAEIATSLTLLLENTKGRNEPQLGQIEKGMLLGVLEQSLVLLGEDSPMVEISIIGWLADWCRRKSGEEFAREIESRYGFTLGKLADLLSDLLK